MDANTDLLKLHKLDLEGITKAIEVNFEGDTIYSSMANVLVAVNPCRELPIYGPETVSEYKERMRDAPHPYKVAQSALDAVSDPEVNHQAILVSGESGSGKSRTAGYLLDYLTFAAGLPVDQVESLRQGCTMLEYFGNAQTILNPNSSRFVRRIEISLDAAGSAATSVAIHCDLLCSARVSHRNEGESNFHVLQLIGRHLEPKGKESAGWRLLGKQHAATEALPHTWKDVKLWLEAHNGTEGADAVEKILSAILYLGEVHFGNTSGHDQCKDVCKDPSFQQAAVLLGISPQALAARFKQSYLQVGSEKIRQSRTASGAAACRDALCIFLYETVFFEVQKAVNHSLGTPLASGNCKKISVLDIFGFEASQRHPNTLEQLVINHFNEVVHGIYQERVFSDLEDDLKTEGFNAVIKYTDNKPTLQLLEKEAGIFGCINDSSKHRAGSGPLLDQLLRKNPLEGYKGALGQFEVGHYAATVKYATPAMPHTNRNCLPEDLYSLVAGSSKLIDIRSSMPTASRSSTDISTFVLGKAIHSVKTLRRVLSTANIAFIKCIRPNDKLEPAMLDMKRLQDQLSALGVGETVKVFANGFPYRLDKPRVYQLLSNGSSYVTDDASLCLALDSLGVSARDYLVGTSRVFLSLSVWQMIQPQPGSGAMLETRAMTSARAPTSRPLGTTDSRQGPVLTRVDRNVDTTASGGAGSTDAVAPTRQQEISEVTNLARQQVKSDQSVSGVPYLFAQFGTSRTVHGWSKYGDAALQLKLIDLAGMAHRSAIRGLQEDPACAVGSILHNYAMLQSIVYATGLHRSMQAFAELGRLYESLL